MLEAGRTAPDFTLPDQDGEELTLSNLRGETVNEARSYAALYVPPSTLDALGRREQVTLDDFGGDLYEVEVIGKVVADRDYAEAVSERSWEAAGARVICVLERRVPPDLSVLSHP